jgi:hypothetical protein
MVRVPDLKTGVPTLQVARLAALNLSLTFLRAYPATYWITAFLNAALHQLVAALLFASAAAARYRQVCLLAS